MRGDRTHARLCAMTHAAFARLGDAAPSSEIVEHVKREIARGGLPSAMPHQLTAAYDAVRIVRQKRGLHTAPPAIATNAEPTSRSRAEQHTAPPTRAEAADILRRYHAAHLVKPMPRARWPSTLLQAERMKAWRILRAGVIEQAERCQAVEREAHEAAIAAIAQEGQELTGAALPTSTRRPVTPPPAQARLLDAAAATDCCGDTPAGHSDGCDTRAVSPDARGRGLVGGHREPRRG